MSTVRLSKKSINDLYDDVYEVGYAVLCIIENYTITCINTSNSILYSVSARWDSKDGKNQMFS